MRLRLQAVLLTYVTRPMVWVVGGIYLLVLGIAFYPVMNPRQVHSTQAAYPGGTGSIGAKLYLNGADQDFERGAFHHQITAVEIRWLTSGSTAPAEDELKFESTLRRLLVCRNLKSLEINRAGRFSDGEISAMSELRRVEHLALHGVTVTPHLWDGLARLPQLRQLDLSGCMLEGGYPGLESMSKVETLILGSPGAGGIIERDAPMTSELRRLPRLKTLVLGAYSSRETHTSPRSSLRLPPLIDSIEDFNAIPTLRTLYVNEAAAEFPGFVELQRKLPRIAVRPAYVDMGRFGWIFAILLLNSLLMGLISAQLHSHFAHPAAHLIPGYLWPHLIPPVGLWLFSQVHIILLTAKGVSTAVALGVQGACWAVICGLGAASTLSQLAPRRHRWIGSLIGMTAVSVIPLTMLGAIRAPSGLDWHLRGHQPLLTLLFILFGMALPLLALLLSGRLYSMYLERGFNSPPLNLDPVAIQAWQQHVHWQHDKASVRRPYWMQWLLGESLESAIRQSQLPGWRRRLRLWIAGNNMNGKFFPVLLIGIGLSLYAAERMVQSASDEMAPQPLDLRLLLAMSVGLIDLPLVAFLTKWRARRQFFQMESMRPVSRNQFVSQITGAMAWDMIPQGLVYLSLIGWYVTRADATQLNSGWVAAMILIAVARWSLSFGIVFWLILIRRDWLVIMIGFLMGYGLILINIGGCFLLLSLLGVQPIPPDMPDFGPGLAAGSAVAVGLVACLMVGAARLKFQRSEFA